MPKLLVLLIAALTVTSVIVSLSGVAQVSFRKPNWLRILFGPLLLLVGLCICGVCVFSGAPGCKNVEKEVLPLGRLGTLADDLRQPWDSEAAANWPSSVHLATCCEIAYSSPHSAKREFKQLGFSYFETVAAGSMIGYVIGIGDMAVVVFRGTDDSYDWFVNLDSFTSRTEGGGIHSGFYESYIKMKPQVEEVLLANHVKSVWLTGHSLGGALAVICAYELRDVEIKGIITYGQPMVADSLLAPYLDRRFAGKYAHFVNGADIVPRVPPGLLHCGSLVWLVGDEVRRSRPLHQNRGLSAEVQSNEGDFKPLSEEQFFSEKEKIRLRAIEEPNDVRARGMSFRTDFIEDHSMQKYMRAIRSHFK